MRQEDHKTYIAPDNYFIDFVAGNLNFSDHLVIETHVDLNAKARSIVDDLLLIGGSLMEDEDCPQAALNPSCLEGVLSKLDEQPDINTDHKKQSLKNCPKSLQPYLEDEMENLPWKKLVNGVYQYELGVECAHSKARLMMIEPGKGAPMHAHGGPELTLVLNGAFEDESDIYRQGDLAVIMDYHPHQPTAYGTDVCYCLASNTHGIELTSWWGKLLNPFIKF